MVGRSDITGAEGHLSCAREMTTIFRSLERSFFAKPPDPPFGARAPFPESQCDFQASRGTVDPAFAEP